MERYLEKKREEKEREEMKQEDVNRSIKGRRVGGSSSASTFEEIRKQRVLFYTKKR